MVRLFIFLPTTIVCEQRTSARDSSKSYKSLSGRFGVPKKINPKLLFIVLKLFLIQTIRHAYTRTLVIPFLSAWHESSNHIRTLLYGFYYYYFCCYYYCNTSMLILPRVEKARPHGSAWKLEKRDERNRWKRKL